jgi:hypothetical protein
MYKSLLILFLLPIFMKYNDTSHKLLYKCLAHDVMRSARQFSHSYLSYRCKCIVDRMQSRLEILWKCLFFVFMTTRKKWIK